MNFEYLTLKGYPAKRLTGRTTNGADLEAMRPFPRQVWQLYSLLQYRRISALSCSIRVGLKLLQFSVEF